MIFVPTADAISPPASQKNKIDGAEMYVYTKHVSYGANWSLERWWQFVLLFSVACEQTLHWKIDRGERLTVQMQIYQRCVLQFVVHISQFFDHVRKADVIWESADLNALIVPNRSQLLFFSPWKKAVLMHHVTQSQDGKRKECEICEKRTWWIYHSLSELLFWVLASITRSHFLSRPQCD